MASYRPMSNWMENLVRYVDGLQQESMIAAEKASAYLHDVVVDRARTDPNWSPMADNIEMWSQDGHLVLGVSDETLMSEAFLLEYGDEVRPPNPLFRTLGQDARAAGEVMRNHMQNVYGPGGQFH